MALDQKAQYPVGTAAPTADYPEGSALNETVLDALDGFPWEKEGINDRFGFEQALLRASQQAASGTPDTALASQYLQGVIELASGRAAAYDDGGAANAYVMDLRTGQQFAAGLFIGLAVQFVPANGNTGAATLDYNGTIDALVDRVGGALVGGELTAGIEATAVWDGVDWRLMSGAAVDLLTDTFTHEMTADADYTLTADGNRSGRIVITDTVVTLTGPVNIVVADIKRVFFAQNDTAETLTFKTSAGTGVAVAAGKSTQLLCDGADVISPSTAPLIRYESTQQTITSAGQLILPHGLGIRPFNIHTQLVCQSANNGYSIGDVIEVYPFYVTTNIGLSVISDATNITVRFGSSATVFGLINAATGNSFLATNTDWKLVVKAAA